MAANAGDVLTADGAGAAGWEPPSGGAPTLPINLDNTSSGDAQVVTTDGSPILIQASDGVAPNAQVTASPGNGVSLTHGSSAITAVDGLPVQVGNVLGISVSGPYGGPFGFVSVQTGTPVGGGFNTQFVFDDTAVTGGLYCWGGADYVKVGGPL